MDGSINVDHSSDNPPNAEEAPEVQANDVSHHEDGCEITHANDSVPFPDQQLNNFATDIAIGRGIVRKLCILEFTKAEQCLPQYSLQLNGSRISLLSCYHFSLTDLVQTFLREHSAEQPVDSVIVKSAFYGKKLKLPHHEFVLLELGNTQDLALRNHVVLDRNRLDGASILSSVQKSDSSVSRDEFRFSCDGNREKLLKRCDLTPYEAIETIELPSSDPLPFYELAIIALATSLQRNYYHLLDANCYWFAGLIWEQVLQMYPEAKHEILRDGVRGKFGSLFKYAPGELELDEIGVKAQAMLSQIEAIITGTQTLWETSATEEQLYNSGRTKTQVHHDAYGSSLAPNARNTSTLEHFMIPPGVLRQLYSTRRLLTCAYGERHRGIFPTGFDNIHSSSWLQRSYYSFPPEALYDVLTTGFNPEHHIEDIIVKTASYCSRTTLPKYHFILLEVEDRRSPGLKNFIVLVRNINVGYSLVMDCISNIEIGQSPAAKDDHEFRVSYDGDKMGLLARCGLQIHETLETLVFKREEPLLLYQFATIARVTTFQRDTYRGVANSSWFAGFIWYYMVAMRPSAYCKTARGRTRGAFINWLRQSTEMTELKVGYGYIQMDLLYVDEILASQRQVSVGMAMNRTITDTTGAQRWLNGHNTPSQNEIEETGERIRELEARVDSRPNPDVD